jgi:hypothetical protein
MHLEFDLRVTSGYASGMCPQRLIASPAFGPAHVPRPSLLEGNMAGDRQSRKRRGLLQTIMLPPRSKGRIHIVNGIPEMEEVIPQALRAEHEADADTIIKVQLQPARVGSYTDGSPAYSQVCIVDVIDVRESVLIDRRGFKGSMPQHSKTWGFNYQGVSGDYPREQLRRYVSVLTNQSVTWPYIFLMYSGAMMISATLLLAYFVVSTLSDNYLLDDRWQNYVSLIWSHIPTVIWPLIPIVGLILGSIAVSVSVES